MQPSEKTARVQNLLSKTAQDSRKWDISALRGGDTHLNISFLNAHAVNTASNNAAFYDFMRSSDYLLRDGIGVKLALKLFSLGETDNLNGTDLITTIIFTSPNRKIAIFGASDETMKACRQRLVSEGIANIVATEHGFHDDAYYLKICDDLKPDLVILCMGMPRQELLAKKMSEANIAATIICGGGWADFYSGVKQRAPLWIRKLSLEWLHRLWREPKRLGRRYTIDIVYYFYLVITARFIRT